MQRNSAKLLATAAIAAAALAGTATTAAHAQECTIGEIRLFGGNFAPRGYALADGQLLPISQNQALFSILGTTYGGDGRTNFALPDLRGRAPVHAGTGPGLTRRRLGEKGGSETNTLTAANMPSHTHAATTTATLKATDSSGRSSDPTGNVLADDGSDRIYSDATANVDMGATAITATTTVQNTGGNQAVNNMQPYQAVNYIVCLVGIFPSRS